MSTLDSIFLDFWDPAVGINMYCTCIQIIWINLSERKKKKKELENVIERKDKKVKSCDLTEKTRPTNWRHCDRFFPHQLRPTDDSSVFWRQRNNPGGSADDRRPVSSTWSAGLSRMQHCTRLEVAQPRKPYQSHQLLGRPLANVWSTDFTLSGTT